MTKGRKPKPTHLKLVAGNPGKRALPENEPKPVRERPNKPAGMSGPASKIWDIVADETFKMGVLTTADGPALRMFCEAWARFFEARRAILQFGSMTYETEGVAGMQIKLHPLVGVQERAERTIRSWCSEFGLTPAARARVEKALDDGEEDEIESFFSA